VAEAERSVEKPCVVRDAGALENLDQFVAVRMFAVMDFLGRDVLPNRFAGGGADGQCGVAFLPCEGGKAGRFVNPC
jgi:hypothetical protein